MMFMILTVLWLFFKYCFFRMDDFVQSKSGKMVFGSQTAGKYGFGKEYHIVIDIGKAV